MDTSRGWLRYCSRFDRSMFSRPVARQGLTARNDSQAVATTKLSQDDTPQVTKLQPYNFSFTKHSVTSLRGRVLLSQSSVCKNKYQNFHAQVDMLNPLHETLCTLYTLEAQSRQRPMFGLTSICTHASWNQPLYKPPDQLNKCPLRKPPETFMDHVERPLHKPLDKLHVLGEYKY